MWYLRTTVTTSAGDFCGITAHEAELLHVDRLLEPPVYTVLYLKDGLSIEVQTELHR